MDAHVPKINLFPLTLDVILVENIHHELLYVEDQVLRNGIQLFYNMTEELIIPSTGVSGVTLLRPDISLISLEWNYDTFENNF